MRLGHYNIIRGIKHCMSELLCDVSNST